MTENPITLVASAAKKVDEWRTKLEAAVVAAYKADESVTHRQLARAAGYSEEGIRKLLSRHGVASRTRGRRRQAEPTPEPAAEAQP